MNDAKLFFPLTCDQKVFESNGFEKNRYVHLCEVQKHDAADVLTSIDMTTERSCNHSTSHINLWYTHPKTHWE